MTDRHATDLLSRRPGLRGFVPRLAVPAVVADGEPGGGAGPTTRCVTFNGWSNTAAYSRAWAAISTRIDFRSACYVTYTVTYANNATGDVFVGGSGQLLNSSFSGTVEADFLDFSTSYTVTLTIADQSGLAILRESANVTTPTPKTGA